MREKFKNLTTLTTSTIISTVIGGVFWFFIASVLGAEKYGEVSYLISIGIIASTIALGGTASTLTVYVAKGDKIQSTIFFISITASIISALILFLILNNIEIAIYVIGYVVFTLTASDLLGKKHYSEYSKILITQKILLVGLTTIMYFVIGFQGIILGIGLSFLPYAFLLYKEFRKIKIDFNIIRKRKYFMMNSFVLDITGILHGSFDKIIIVPIIGFTLVGNYQLGLQFFAILHLIPVILTNYTLPNDASGNANILLKKIVIIFSVIIVFFTILLAPVILPIVFPEYTEAVQIIQVLSISIIPVTIVSTFISKYLGNGNNKIVLIGSGINVVISIPTLLLLTLTYGVIGAAVSTVISSSIHAIYYLIIDHLLEKNNHQSNS